MTLIRSCRTSARSSRARFVPGGLACAASARRLFQPTPLQISPTLKMASGFFSAKRSFALRPVAMSFRNKPPRAICFRRLFS